VIATRIFFGYLANVVFVAFVRTKAVMLGTTVVDFRGDTYAVTARDIHRIERSL
jgi:hypothetical protein